MLNLVAAVIAATIFWFLLFPIGFTVPTHGDIYGYSILFDGIPFSSIPYTPRPMMGLFIKLGGMLQFDLMMAFFSVIGLISLVSPLLVYQFIFKRRMPFVGNLLYFALITSHSANYLGLVHDLGSRLALIFAALAVCSYAKYYETKGLLFLIVGGVLALLGFFSKETFGLFLIAVVLYIGILFKMRLRHLVISAASVLVGLVLSLYHSRWTGSPFTSDSASYVLEFNLIDIARLFVKFITLAISPQLLILVSVVVVVLVVKRKFETLYSLLVLMVISCLAIVPNSLLTKHGGSNYEMILVPLFALSIAAHMDRCNWFTCGRIKSLSFILLLLVSNIFWANHSLKTNYWWEMGIANFNKNAINSIKDSACKIKAAKSVMVIGLQSDHIVQPWTPFTSSEYLIDNFRFKEVTFFIVGKGYFDSFRKQNSSNRIYVESTNYPEAHLTDLVLVFDQKGSIWKSISARDDINKLLMANDLVYEKLYDSNYWAEHETLRHIIPSIKNVD